MRMNFVIAKQNDIDGFSSYKCSLCGEEFKLQSSESQAEDVLEFFCPNCGIPSPISTFYTEDILKHAEALVMNEAVQLLNDMFKKFERSSRGNKHITIKRGKPIPTEHPRILYEKDDLEQIEYLCCEKKAKLTLLSKTSRPFCPYCGVN